LIPPDRPRLRILHAPFNIANIGWELSRAQRLLGHDASIVQYYSSWARFQCDENLALERFKRPRRVVEMIRFLARAIRRYDVFHFHFGWSLLPKFVDVPLLKALGKTIVFHFHGCDIKSRAVLIKEDRFSACRACHPIKCNLDIELSKRVANRYATAVFMGTPDLIQFYPRSQWLPPPIHVDEIEEAVRGEPEPHARDRVRLVHAPSDRALKGTSFVLEAVSELERRGRPVDFQLVEGQPWRTALRTFQTAHIVADQFRMGAYGHLAAECMALGKPVLCFIREGTRPHYPPDLPIVNARGDRLADAVESLADDPLRRQALGEAGRRYVAQYHDPLKIAERTVAAYRAR
jgi:glycosyltransferase involved in cell wall biosynthesis